MKKRFIASLIILYFFTGCKKENYPPSIPLSFDDPFVNTAPKANAGEDIITTSSQCVLNGRVSDAERNYYKLCMEQNFRAGVIPYS